MKPEPTITTGQENGLSRRAFNTLTALSAIVVSQVASGNEAVITREDFEEYIEIFNRGNSDDYARYYHDDVVLERGDLRLEGKDAILSFYRSFHESVTQHIQVLDFISEGDRFAVELLASFEAFDDWSHPLAGTMARGTRRQSHTFVHYHQRDGKFYKIRSALFQRL